MSPAIIFLFTKQINLFFFRENMPSHFKVKEYCPLVFRNLRERFGVDDVDYRESLTRSQPIHIESSSGKSGAQFYQSYDKFFIIKSLTSEEIERMHAFLKQYHPVSFSMAWGNKTAQIVLLGASNMSSNKVII